MIRWRHRLSGIGRATGSGEASTSRRDAGAQRRDGSRGGFLCVFAALREIKRDRTPDANFNGTSITDTCEVVREPCTYDPYGARTILDADNASDVDRVHGVNEPAYRDGDGSARKTDATNFVTAEYR